VVGAPFGEITSPHLLQGSQFRLVPQKGETTMSKCHCGSEKETYDVFDRETGEVVGEETTCPMRWHPAHPES